MSTKIGLNISTIYDINLLEQNISCRLVRLYGRIRFEKEKGWSNEYRAIIDTGSPVSLIPSSIWKEIKLEFLSQKEFPILGIAKEESEPILARIATVKLVFIDPETTSSSFRVKAYLLPTDHIPLLFGFEDLLTEYKLFCDYKNNSAYLEF